jgi:hypothetical protein
MGTYGWEMAGQVFDQAGSGYFIFKRPAMPRSNAGRRESRP